MDVMSNQASSDSLSYMRWVCIFCIHLYIFAQISKGIKMIWVWCDKDICFMLNVCFGSISAQIISCLATLLRKQDLSVWSYPSTLQVYHGLLSFTVHAKPRVCHLVDLILYKKYKWYIYYYEAEDLIWGHCWQVRKAAQQGVCSILRGSEFMFSDNAPSHHPAAVTTAKFCCKEMEQSGGLLNCLVVLLFDNTTVVIFGTSDLITASNGHFHVTYRGYLLSRNTNQKPVFVICNQLLNSEYVFFIQGNKEHTTTLHVLGLLKELLSVFPLSSVKSCCETLLRVMTLSHVVRKHLNSYIWSLSLRGPRWRDSKPLFL